MPSRRDVLAAAGAATAVGVAGCLGHDGDGTDASERTKTDWPVATLDRTGTAYAPDAAAPRTAPSVRWRREIPQPTGRPVVADGTVYLPTMAGLSARDAATGKERWRYYPDDDEGQGWPTSPAVHGGTVYVGTERQGLLALNAEDGSVAWRMPTEGRIEAPPMPAYEWEAIYVGDDRGNVYRVDLDPDRDRAYAVDWTFEAFGGVTAVVSGVPQVYAGTSAGEVYGVYDGRGLWRRKLPGAVRSLTLGNAGPLYVNTFGGGSYQLDDGAHVGRTAWKADRGPVTHGGCVLTADAVLGTDGSGLTALDRGSGDRTWKFGDDFRADPAAAGDTVYVGGENRVVAYALDGGVGVGDVRLDAKRWSREVTGTAIRGLAVADGAVFALTGGGESPAQAYAFE